MILLEIKNLSKKYKTAVACKDVSFSVEQNAIFGLLGPNGAGKSTTISMICGLTVPTSGKILLRGKDITNKPGEIKKILGLVPQDIALYPSLTARENLAFWGKLYGLKGRLLAERVDQALEYAGLSNRASERIETYSGGMKRRINVAVALLHHPELLIMDEPTVGIDPQSRTYILETVLQLNKQGITVIYTSHYMEEVEYLCSQIAIMDKGSVIACGTSEELKKMVGDADKIDVELNEFSGRVPEAIIKLPGVSQVTTSDSSISILAVNGREKIASLLSIMTDAGLKVRSVSIHEPDLESVFLSLTGRGLRD